MINLYCNNMLHITGNKKNINDFLYSFFDGHYSCKMNNIIKCIDNRDIDWKLDNWGNSSEILDSSSLTSAINKIEKINKYYFKTYVNYGTLNTTNLNFIINTSIKYPKLRFYLSYFIQELKVGKKFYIKNGEIKESINYEIKDNKNDKDEIKLYDFLYDEEIININNFENYLFDTSNKTKNHIINKFETEGIIYDYEDILKDYFLKNINNILEGEAYE